MEWLGRIIHANIFEGKWCPIHFSRRGPDLSHLFFAYYLVIFSKTDLDQAQLLVGILNHFYEFSGHKINIRKSNIYFSKGTEDGTCNRISQLFGYQIVQNLGVYLGVPLLHERVTKSTLSFIVDKIRRKLHNWEARKLSIAKIITLAQSVLLTIPNYFMQSLSIPKGVCDEIEHIMRQFIWGSTSGHSKLALVGWDNICQPISRGDLGFCHLHDQNNSFLLKIGFNLITKDDALWVRILLSKYGWKEKIPSSISRSQCSHLWCSLSKVWTHLRDHLAWSVVMVLAFNVGRTRRSRV